MTRTTSIFLLLFLSTAVLAKKEPKIKISRQELPNDKIIKLKNGDLKLGAITLHKKYKEISFPAVFSPSVDIEVLIATAKGRTHESLVQTDASPFQTEIMLYLLGADNEIKRPVKNKRGSLIDIDIEWIGPKGNVLRDAIENFVLDRRTNSVMKRQGFYFVGSSVIDNYPQAEGAGNIALLYSHPATVLDNVDPESHLDGIHGTMPNISYPLAGSPIRVIMSIRPEKKLTPKVIKEAQKRN